MTTVSVRMDENLKRDFDEICNELGLSMTTAITMLAKKICLLYTSPSPRDRG